MDFERGPLNPLSLEYRGPPIKGKGWKAKPRQSHQIGSGRDSPDTENEFVSESPRQSKTQAETCQVPHLLVCLHNIARWWYMEDII